MAVERQRMPERRYSETVTVEFSDGQRSFDIHVTVGFRPEGGGIGEVFARLAKKAGGVLDGMLGEASILISRELQRGTGLDELRRVFGRDNAGGWLTPLGAVLGVLVELQAELGAA